MERKCLGADGCASSQNWQIFAEIFPFRLGGRLGLSYYPKLGYRLAGIKEVPFQGLSEMVELAMFEKRL